VAINIVAAGLTAVLGAAWFRQGGQTPSVSDQVRMGPLSTDVANALQGSPLLEAFLGQSGLVYIAFIAVLASWWLLWKTRFGLRLRAVGENPSMVESAGVSVQRMRYSALVINGLLCGLAGSYLVLSLSASFVPHMSAGRGFMALAALIFGKWKPKATLLACLLFGFLDAAAIRLQGVVLPTIGEIPVQFIQALPYLLTVILLAGFIGKAVAPKAIGVPYTKERT
jgi:simple sugar transport system permease protein